MAWGYVQSAQVHAAAAHAVTTAFTTQNVASGTKIIGAAVMDAAAAWSQTSTCLDNNSNSLTNLFNTTFANRTRVELWAMDTPAGDVGTKPSITWTATGASLPTECSLIIQEVSGLLVGNTTAMLDGTPGTVNGAGNVATGDASYTSTAVNRYLVSIYGDDGGPLTYTAPAGYTVDPANVNSSANNDLAIAYKNSTNASETGNGWGLSGSATGWSFLVVAFKLASGAATPIPNKIYVPNFAQQRAASY